MSKKIRKKLVFDTSVILYDPKSIFSFPGTDIIIPAVVLEELDNFKNGYASVHRNARVFDKYLDQISHSFKMIDNIYIDEYDIRISIDVQSYKSEMYWQDIGFDINKTDNYILACALFNEAKLVSKDTNLRVKARSLGVEAIDYVIDGLINIHDNDIYTGYRIVNGVSSDLIDKLYNNGVISVEELELYDLHYNEYLCIKNHTQSCLAVYNKDKQIVLVDIPASVANIKPRNMEQTFALHALLNPDINIVTITGKAGTGKTLLAIAAAIGIKSKYRQILLARPVVPIGNDIGFLPGDINEKLSPYMQPLYDNLDVIKNVATRGANIDKLLEEHKIIVEPVTFIRGRSLPNVFFIVDEAQNLTPHEIKTIVTRAGENSKIVLVGDIYQIDHPYLDTQSNGLTYLIHRFLGQQMYAHINLVKGERSPLAELASMIL